MAKPISPGVSPHNISPPLPPENQEKNCCCSCLETAALSIKNCVLRIFEAIGDFFCWLFSCSGSESPPPLPEDDPQFVADVDALASVMESDLARLRAAPPAEGREEVKIEAPIEEEPPHEEKKLEIAPPRESLETILKRLSSLAVPTPIQRQLIEIAKKQNIDPIQAIYQPLLTELAAQEEFRRGASYDLLQLSVIPNALQEDPILKSYLCQIDSGLIRFCVNDPTTPIATRYERSAIIKWLTKNPTSPFTRQRFTLDQVTLSKTQFSIDAVLKRHSQILNELVRCGHVR